MGEDQGRQEALGRQLDACQSEGDNPSGFDVAAAYSPLQFAVGLIPFSREWAAFHVIR
jgi:hypothetical protein